MKLKDYLLPEIEREIDRSRRALEQVPADQYDWKPHEKSMIFGYLVNMVATIPTWITLQITQDQLDIAPADRGNVQQKRLNTSEELLKALDEAATGVRSAFEKTTDEHLQTNWRLLARGQVVMYGRTAFTILTTPKKFVSNCALASSMEISSSAPANS